ncbi:hypothetical protein [Amycolatopsis sp. CB00013]|uniref:hypothetical protein n=1 Tax=Amycolatopsis sp. CB00013 TaxID=1703945 RepID=UPI00093A96AB|nr:hypothetical protein [Amycolatopsis sp. CB00013]OKJ95505.1 hypothetical protein AMK34_20895 [Amycolatopsis sp. CB00013]
MTASMLTASFKFLFDRASAVLDRRAEAKKGDSKQDQAKDAPEELAKLQEAMRALNVYREHNLTLSKEDAGLVGLLEDVHAELEKILGEPIDLEKECRPGVRVEVENDDVTGGVTGLRVGDVAAGGSADVKVRNRDVKRGAEVTGMWIEGTLG